MVEPFYTDVDDDEIKREKAKARALRNSQWWKRRRSTGVCYYCGRKFKPAELTMDQQTSTRSSGKGRAPRRERGAFEESAIPRKSICC
ncbi:MAG: hypothetical protein MPW16_18805 [Candidatus Manganitrophus sp.]|nr:MAG: hypothetical protein MPW16_18805 [Candidatus Manganitrophus sp.]